MRLVPALQDLYRDTHPIIVVQKAAQVFVSEYLINTALWVADTGQGGRGNALYVMPTQGHVDDFSQARFDKAIAEIPYLQSRLYPPPPGRPGPARQQLKKVGLGYIYLRGSDSRRQLTSVDADVVLVDEYDLMGEGVLELAQKRLASSKLGCLRVASTPRLPEAGINGLFLQSDQRYYFLKCPACGLAQHLEWEHNVDQKRARVICRSSGCRKPLDLWTPGHWEITCPGNSDVHGYHVSRLYSPLANLRAMIDANQDTTPAGLREFHNSHLGETFVPPGGQLSFGDVDACRGDYDMPDAWGEDTYMGVDVGTKLHVVIRQRLEEDRSHALFIGEVDLQELDRLMTRYHVRRCVVDALPEQRWARDFAKRWRYSAWLALYDRQEGGHRWDKNADVLTVHINHVEALDEMFERFHQAKAELPSKARYLGGRVENGLGDYYRHMTAIHRILEQNAQGNWAARYLDGGKADHYAYAETYCALALHWKEPSLGYF